MDWCWYGSILNDTFIYRRLVFKSISWVIYNGRGLSSNNRISQKTTKEKAGKIYWFYVYPESSPNVKGLWRIRGTDNLVYGKPDNNKIKILDKNTRISERKSRTDFAIGFMPERIYAFC